MFSVVFSHTRFVTYRVKDAIVDYFQEKVGKRPSIRVSAADFVLNVHISADEVTISLDSSGAPLYKRGWRVAQTEAPINEVLAAGIIKLSGWDGQCNFVDPMCGSGTFLVEAALIAANKNQGVYRKEFAFQNWSDYDAELFDSIYNDDSQEREFKYKIYGSDVAVQAIAIAESNIKSAGVSKMIELKQRALADWEEAPEKGVVVTNPPYGERLKYQDINELYETLGKKLKFVFKGYDAWVISYGELTDLIGLRPSVNYPLLNGDLECELREYKIFDGSYKDMKAEGGSIRNEGFRAADKDRGQHRPVRKQSGGQRRGALAPPLVRQENAAPAVTMATVHAAVAERAAMMIALAAVSALAVTTTLAWVATNTSTAPSTPIWWCATKSPLWARRTSALSFMAAATAGSVVRNNFS